MEGKDLRTNQMDEKWRRIEGLVRSSNIFLFGLLPGSQSIMYRYLAYEKGFRDKSDCQYRGSYSKVLNDIIQNQGIERLVGEIIIPLAKNEFNHPVANGKSILDVLKVSWDKGEPPKKDAILLHKTGIEKQHEKDSKSDLIYETYFESHQEYGDRKQKYGKGSCKLLDITEVGDKWVVRFSEFCKLWYTELAELDQVSNQVGVENLQIAENSALIDYSKNPDNLIKTNIPTLAVEVTNLFFKELETIPYDLSGENHQKMITKILVLTSLSKLPETKPIYDQLSRTIDFGQMMSLVTITGGNSRTGESKHE